MYIPLVLFSHPLYMPEACSASVARESILISIAIIVIVLSVKCRSAKERFLRTLLMQISLRFVFVLNGHIGTIRRLNDFFHITELEANSSTAGLGIAFYFMIVDLTCIIVNILWPLFKMLISTLNRVEDDDAEPNNPDH